MSFQLPELPYAYNALEPHFDAQTMEIHHSKHHAGYTSKLNAAIEGSPLASQSIEEILSNTSNHSGAVRNNGGGYFNHCLFWEILGPNTSNPQGELLEAIQSGFDGFDQFKKVFSEAAASRFGSGWAWLIVNASGNLEVCSTPNQDNPLMDIAETKGTPILGLDVWEHAYYLKYQNKRPDYIEAFWNLVNWETVAEKYTKAKALSTV